MKDFEPASTTTARKVDVAPWRTAVPISSTALTRKRPREVYGKNGSVTSGENGSVSESKARLLCALFARASRGEERLGDVARVIE